MSPRVSRSAALVRAGFPPRRAYATAVSARRENDASSRPSPPSRTLASFRALASRSQLFDLRPGLELGSVRLATRPTRGGGTEPHPPRRFTRAVVSSASARASASSEERVAERASPRARRQRLLHGVALGDERGDAGLERRDAIRAEDASRAERVLPRLAVLRAPRASRKRQPPLPPVRRRAESLDVVVFPVWPDARGGAWRARGASEMKRKRSSSPQMKRVPAASSVCKICTSFGVFLPQPRLDEFLRQFTRRPRPGCRPSRAMTRIGDRAPRRVPKRSRMTGRPRPKIRSWCVLCPDAQLCTAVRHLLHTRTRADPPRLHPSLPFDSSARS